MAGALYSRAVGSETKNLIFFCVLLRADGDMAGKGIVLIASRSIC